MEYAGVVAILIALLIIFTFLLWPPGAKKDGFWTRYSAVPPDEQARRFDAAEKGVPDMAWAEAYWPPNYCIPTTPSARILRELPPP